ncbi:MAG: cobyric acid synthase [Acidimicrobiales bacterium]
MHGALMVCGTASDAGKSHVVTGLCRSLHRRGVRVAPFKGQNMSLNSFVTTSGHEIGRAQATQAFAAGVEPEVVMNPVLLKPTSETGCQVVVMGRPTADLDAFGYHAHKPELFPVVLAALADLRGRFDVVLLEGAGSPAEINLLDHDIVNLPLAVAAGVRAIVVGDIDRGGVFASLAGTVALLPPEQRAAIGGFVINKLRGDPALLLDGAERLERHTGVPTLGVLPWIDDVALDAEDSLALAGPRPRSTVTAATMLDVAVVRFPHLANATDLDPVAIEAGVGVRWVTHAAGLGDPDVVVLPGTKSTVADLAWLRAVGLDRALAGSTATVLGICGGYQMLGHRIHDLAGVEAPAGTVVDGLGWLDVATTFHPEKVTAQRTGFADGRTVHGYEIHHGRTTLGPHARPWLHLDSGPEGAHTCAERPVLGTSLHGILEDDLFRQALLAAAAGRRGRSWSSSGVSFAAARDAQIDRLADLVEEHLDLTAIDRLIQERP